MLELFQTQLSDICPGWQGGRFLVAYSGGLDSSALLHLSALSLPKDQLAAGHLNHLIRPEAGSDQAFAARTAAELGLKFISEEMDVPSLAAERRRGLEEAARFARYVFLKQAAKIWRADYILTAHQADDQAETILMRLVKGGGGGLAGIHPRRKLGREDQAGPELLRPLLSFSREQLRAWLTERKLGWVEDASNADGHYLRNALRLDILPRLKELNPRLLDAMGRFASIRRGEEIFWARRLAELWPQLVDIKSRPDKILIDRQALENLTLAEKRRMIYESFLYIWRLRPGYPGPLTLAGVDSAIKMLSEAEHKGLDLPGGLRAELDSRNLVLSLASRLANKA